MARIRSLHPGQWTDEEFVACSFPARVLALGLRNEADDQGVFEWKPLTIKMRILPADQVSAEELLEELVTANQVVRFEAGGRAYGAIRNFRKYQRPKKPVFVHPLPDELRGYVGLDTDQKNVRKEKWAAQDGRCFYCGTEITYYSKKTNSLEIDHRIPVSRGGTDDDQNLAATCVPCNRAKCDMTEPEYREWLAKKTNSHPKPESSEEVAPETPAKVRNKIQRKDEGCKGEEGLSPPVVPPEGDKPKPAKKKRATGLPDDWSLPGEGYMFAARRGWAESEIKREAAKFENHHRAKGTSLKDWNAGWRTWVLKAEEYDPTLGKNGVRADVNMREATDDEKRAYLRSKGSWGEAIAKQGPTHSAWPKTIPADWQEVA